MHRLIAATSNPAKLRELRRLTGGLVTVDSLPHDISPKLLDGELAETVERVAQHKAAAASRALPAGSVVIASDGGLLVPALGDGWDPVRTRRFAGETASDLERSERLLAMTAHLVGLEREIGWREAVAVACDGHVLASWSAESAPGLLAESVDGEAVAAGGGFWIPAVWRCLEFGGRRLSELTAAELASRDDHWSRLAVAVGEWLQMDQHACESPRTEDPGLRSRKSVTN